MEEEISNKTEEVQESAESAPAEEVAEETKVEDTAEDVNDAAEEVAKENRDGKESAPEERKDDRKMYPAKCSDCGNDCEVPFEPEEGKPVKCKDCFMKSRPPRRNFNNNRGGNNRGFDRGPREMHDATCTKCNKSCQVPFKPTPGKDVLCQDCFRANRN